MTLLLTIALLWIAAAVIVIAWLRREARRSEIRLAYMAGQFEALESLRRALCEAQGIDAEHHAAQLRNAEARTQ